MKIKKKKNIVILNYTELTTPRTMAVPRLKLKMLKFSSFRF